MKNRSRLEIIASILETTANPGATSTKIIYRTFTSYSMLQEYLLFMLERNLIEIKEKEKQTSSSFISTDKGRRFLHVYNKLSEMIGRKTN
jgi:predicted transcriptional regulator